MRLNKRRRAGMQVWELLITQGLGCLVMVGILVGAVYAVRAVIQNWAAISSWFTG